MNPSVIIEKWDGLLYTIYNYLQYLKSLFSKLPYLNKNKDLENKHKGERCFIIMNGPSINALDLHKLKSEVVFCSNYFYRAEIAKVVDPNYYFWADSKIFFRPEGKEVVGEIRNTCPNAHLLLNSKAYSSLGYNDNVYYVHCKHIPNVYSIKTSLSGITSNYSTVAFHAISAALYMGFDRIYVLGLDFAPGAFKHFVNLGAECEDPLQKMSKEDVCGNYWNYTKAHYESYYLQAYAKKHNQKIINLNSGSYIRAFEFGDYNTLFK